MEFNRKKQTRSTAVAEIADRIALEILGMGSLRVQFSSCS